MLRPNINTRLIEIDYTKGISAVAVILIHISAYFTEVKAEPHWYSTIVFINRAVSFAVPCFVVMTAMLLYRKYGDRLNGIRKIKGFYKKRFLAVLPGYLLYSAVYQYYLYINKSSVTPKSVLRDILYATSSYHLWFFLLLFEIYLFFPLLVYLFKRFKKNLPSILIVCFLSGFLYQKLLENVAFMPNMNHYLPLSSFFDYTIYIALGITLAIYFEPIKRSLERINYSSFLFIGVIMLISVTWPVLTKLKEGIYFYQIPSEFLLVPKLITPFYNIIVITLLLKLTWAIKREDGLAAKLCGYFGGVSFNLYLVHVIVLDLIVTFLAGRNIAQNRLIFYPITFLVTLFASLLLIQASKCLAQKISAFRLKIQRFVARKQFTSNYF